MTQGVLPPPLWRLLLRDRERERRQEVVSAFLEFSLSPCSLPSITLSEGIIISLSSADLECALGGIYKCLRERKDRDHRGRFHPDSPDPDPDLPPTWAPSPSPYASPTESSHQLPTTLQALTPGLPFLGFLLCPEGPPPPVPRGKFFVIFQDGSAVPLDRGWHVLLALSSSARCLLSLHNY